MAHSNKAFGGVYDHKTPVQGPTRWEQFVNSMGLSESDVPLTLTSRSTDVATKLRNWVFSNYRGAYVPESVLLLMGIDTGFIE